MQIQLPREVLLKPLSQVAGVVERRQTLPILSNILFKLDSGKLVLTGTDLEIEVIAEIPVDVEGGAETTIPARKLLDICRALPSDATVTLTVDGDKVQVKSGKSRFSLLTMPSTEFPNLETTDWSQTFTLPQKTLKGLIERTQFSMAQQDVRYYLNGLLLEMSKDQLRAVATDGHRMAISTTQVDSRFPDDKQIILPRKGVNELARFLEESDTPVTVQISANHLRASLPGLIFTTKLIDGRFPDYNKVIPQNQTKQIHINREVFRNALNRAAILSNEKYRGIRLTLTPGALTITAHNPEQEEACEELEIDYQGDEMEIGFNSNYISDAVGALGTETVEVALHDSNSSGALREPGDQNTLYVVMPMRL